MQLPLDTLIAPDTESYIDQFERLRDRLPGHNIEWLNRQREKNLARFGRIGFPTTRDEDWKYTSVRGITGKRFVVDGELDDEQRTVDLSPFAIEGLESHRLVFVDGLFDPGLSTIGGAGESGGLNAGGLDGGLGVESFAMALARDPTYVESLLGSVVQDNGHGFTALNNAMYRDGVIITFAARAEIARPLEIIHYGRAQLSISQPRNLIVCQRQSRGQIIERYVSGGAHNTLANSVTEALLEDGASLDYYLVQNQSAAAYQVCGVWAKQSARSRFSCRTITLGGALTRNDLQVHLDGPEAHCDMLGLYSLSGRQHVDNHTTVVHAVENCSSRELYKGVLDQRSRAVFHGRVRVDEGAQKTDAAQSNNTLLLSRDAEIDTKPQLEIYADDVKCSHGVTVGQLDEGALFYLRARGIGEREARALLNHAFVSDVLSEVEIDPLRRYLESILLRQLINTGDGIASPSGFGHEDQGCGNGRLPVGELASSEGKVS